MQYQYQGDIIHNAFIYVQKCDILFYITAENLVLLHKGVFKISVLCSLEKRYSVINPSHCVCKHIISIGELQAFARRANLPGLSET